MLKIQRESGIFIFTTSNIAGDIEIQEYFGLVSGSAIYGGNFIKDYFARIADRIGGRVRGYESALNAAIEDSLRIMCKKAKQAGANAVISVRIDHGDVNNRMMMANCYGTAIRYRKKRVAGEGE
ncbi:hypothetical protein LMG26857_03269 [Achromobacter anxifer]|uniref:YbjQ family protein n=1 Tax=Achromobacter anxifer TaxID=1287737 RepID=UPI00155C7E61|nr:YbjQ family protein [Achromobacter anxifer]CAB5514230.1 hypothetical protein LMG26857_03269 [Achromobacter anxifer]